MPDKIEIPKTSDKGTSFTINISSESVTEETLFEENEQKANENGEAVIQLLEGCSYEYKLSNNFSFKKLPGILKPSRLNPSSGRLTPGNYVGTLSLDILNETGQSFSSLLLEVRSIKTTYREDYRYMLEYITQTCTDLLMQHTSPVTQTFTVDFFKNSETLYQRFVFVKSILDTDEFNQALHRIISNPVKGWELIDEDSDIRRVKKLNSHQIRQLVSRKDRVTLPEDSELRKHFTSLPRTVRMIKKNETVDIPENRFVKYVLEIFLRFVSEVRHTLEDADCHPKTYNEALILEEKIGSVLKQSIFKEISPPTTLPLNSPVLQRKEGYRQVLRVWLIFDLAAKLIWHGGEDVYSAGKRDVAVLYEYWLFFRLLELLKEIYSINPKSTDDLIEETSDGLGLKIKMGEHFPIEGVYNKEGRSLNVKFSYNRTFSGENEYPREGSWSRSLRPDYTLSLWPSNFSKQQAEEQEIIVHLHFDSKYKIENIAEIIGESGENLDSEKEDQLKGTYKRGDLLKMHAYKDAIRRTGGAYVLYPGKNSKQLKGFHEIIPGLGAFCVRPNKTDDGTAELKSFIIEVTQHLLNKASQRDRLTYHTFDILKSKGDDKIFDKIPEIYEGKRVPHPAETFVLIGYYKDEDHYKWIEKNRLYNFRMNSVKGSLRIDPGVAIADYLLLHTKDNLTTGDIWQILEKGPRIFSKKELINSSYPSPSVDNYLIYKIKKIKSDEFANAEWDLRLLKGFTGGRASPNPFSVSLLELMKAKA